MASQINPEDLKKMLHDGGELALLDVREDGEFGEGHILYANPCAYSHLEARVTERAPRKTTRIVLVDGGNAIAEKASTRLSEIGYSNITILNGGISGWVEVGYTLFKGVNVPCKAFGEMVEHHTKTPHISPQELKAIQKDGKRHVILDGRTPKEFNRMSIPGGISVPNAELVYRVHDLAPDPETTIVINCAGRTRSIIGAQTLINAGVPNPVVALEGGTMGWTLAGFDLENGATRKYDELSEEGKKTAKQRADKIKKDLHIKAVSFETLKCWQGDSERTLFLLDVRSAEEFADGHLPGSTHAPGGQLVQACDEWIATLGARLILLDDENNIRAVTTAHWLKQMGWDVWILEGGVLPHAINVGTETPKFSGSKKQSFATITTAELANEIANGEAVVVDTDVSWLYRAEHIPSAIWCTRARINNLVSKMIPDKKIVLYSEHETRAWLLATDLSEVVEAPIAILRGGREKWREEGRALESSPEVPSNSEQLDFLFFVHDRHQGNEQAMREYLEWEEGLPAQISEDGDARFQVFTK